jgi:aminoglycoside phosphotransferase (APT) family kinase protein
VVVERIPGETIPQRILRDDRLATARGRLAAQFGETLGRIQQVPLDEVPMLSGGDALARYRQVLVDSGHPHPAFEMAFRWLEASRPPPADTVLVHGDYRNGNGIVDPDGLRAVIDWELAHIGDPTEDLAWLCLRAMRFGFPKPVGGLGDYHDVLDAYTAVTGRKVDADTLRWWMVLATVRWGAICVLRAVRHLSGTARSLEYAAIGRRVCEAEYDLLLLLP